MRQELLAAPARSTSPTRISSCRQLGEAGEHRIAGGVAMAVVDALEVVEVDQRDRQPRPTGWSSICSRRSRRGGQQPVRIVARRQR